MPLHKSSSRASRLDPTMISAPLGDFRHTMHIGRGGDAFGDTSFLSTLGPSPPSSDTGSAGVTPGADPEVAVNHGDLHADAPGSPEDSELYSESVSLFTLDLDLDLDLGPSMLGDVLGVMDGLGLDSKEEEDDALSPKSATSSVEKRQGKEATGMSVNTQNELNGKYSVGLDGDQVGESRIPDGNGIKPKGLKPKVRFSDKREEIIRQASEEEEGQGFDFQDENQLLRQSPTRGESERRGESRVVAEGETEFVNHKVGVELPPSPASSHSSENEGDAVPLDRRRSDKVDNCHSETDSEEDEDEEEEEEEEEGGEAGRGYTFEDEFDDEIGL